MRLKYMMPNWRGFYRNNEATVTARGDQSFPVGDIKDLQVAFPG